MVPLFASPIGRGRIALAIRVRGYSRSMFRSPLTPTLSPQGRGSTPAFGAKFLPYRAAGLGAAAGLGLAAAGRGLAAGFLLAPSGEQRT